MRKYHVAFEIVFAAIVLAFALPAGANIYEEFTAGECRVESFFIDGVEVTATPSELNVVDGVTAGTVTASKALVVDNSKDLGDLRNLDAVNIDAGASGTAGTVDVFPTTASKGKLSVTCQDQTGDTTVTLDIDEMGQATTVNIPDPGASAADLLHNLGGQTVAAGNTMTAGAAAAAVAMRFGASATEGLEVKVIDETVELTNAVETDLTSTLPAGAVVLCAQVNLEAAITGDGTGDDGLVKIGLGITADPDQYGKTADLAQNTKIDTIPDWAVIAAEETVTIKGCDAAGAAVTEKFTGGTGQDVRVRIVYIVPNSLDDAS